MKSRTEQDSCCVRVERGVSDLRKERARGTRSEELILFLKSDPRVQQQQRKDRSGLSSFGEKRTDCRISSPSPPFSLMGGETEEACSLSGSHGD